MKKRVKLLISDSVSGNYRFCKNGAIKEAVNQGNINYLGYAYINNLLISNTFVNYSRSEVVPKNYTHYPQKNKS